MDKEIFKIVNDMSEDVCYLKINRCLGIIVGWFPFLH